ncbi:MAG: peptidoglycan DD-metalloendopeptidase family protein [Planctomycetes bacterium]|nr:peptidoglycan DD-metalloendopeptidase family protein [Planctomycetota bacterium]
MRIHMHRTLVLLLLVPIASQSDVRNGPREPLFRTVDLNLGESEEVELSDGTRAKVKLIDIEETRDGLRSAIRQARVKVEVNGKAVTLVSATYHLPVTVAGVQIDCPVTKGYYRNCDPFEDSWGLDKDARLRLWPAGSPWMPPGTFVYPVRQRWFASATQMANEPAFVDGGDAPSGRKIYYHSGLDIGGCEGLVEVVAAREGLVVSAGGEALPEYPDLPFYVRGGYDYVYIVDSQGWFYRYAHLKSIDPAVRPGQRVKMGQKLGVLCKEGSSGGWAHLHFDIKSRQPSGKWGIQEGYAFLWEAYHREYAPQLVAVARPHHLASVGEKVVLDGSRSWCATDKIAHYEWTFGDGSTAAGPQVERTYDRPGTYSEILKVADSQGRVDYDFAAVQVLDKAEPDKLPPTIHASYAPTFGIRPGDPVTFKVRTFRTTAGSETWDFGDGSPPVTVRSDGNAEPLSPNGYAETVHRYAKPGHYLVRVERTGHTGARAATHLQVRVDETPTAADERWQSWLERRLLPADEAKSMMSHFVETQFKPLPLPESHEIWESRREALRQEVLRILGLDDLVPAKWDLAIQQKGTIRREGYRIEKSTFESYPGMTVPALVYVPEGIKERVPGIVSISGHTYALSKAADYIQQRNVNLALRGCVVLSYDYIDCGERNTGPDPFHRKPYGGGNDHGIRSFSFSSRTPTALEVLDGIRAVDVLVNRPEVDPERIGFTGESGGSNSTYWVAALDPRVKVAVPVSSVTTFDYWIRTDGNWDWHQRPPGIRRIADIGTLLALHAPRPLLVISSRRGTDDQEFPLDEAEKSFQWAKHVYRLLAAEDAVDHYESTTEHGYQEDKRRRLYRWVERWLKPPAPKGDVELATKVETFDELRCGLPKDNRTLRDIYAEWLKPLPRTVHPSDRPSDAELRVFLQKRLGLPDPVPDVKGERIGQEEKGLWSAEFWLLEPEPGIRLPAILIRRKGQDGPITLVQGRDKEAAARALAADRRVLVFDLRGTGEMRHGEGGTWPSMAGPPWPELLGEAGASMSNWAWFAERPWPGMWALDLLQAARFCREKLSAPCVSVDAENPYGWPALLAGAAAPELIASGSVRLRLASLHDDVRARGDHALADVPGMLERLDIPQLRALWPGGQVSVERSNLSIKSGF